MSRPVYLASFATWTPGGVAINAAPKVGAGLSLGAWPEAPPLSAVHPKARKPYPSARVLVQLGSALLSEVTPEARARMGFCVGTVAGCAVADREFQKMLDERGGPFGSPSVFVYTLATAPLGEVSIALGVRGPLRTVSAGGASGLSALSASAALVAQGSLEDCLCGGVELGGAEPSRAFGGADALALFHLTSRPGPWRLTAHGTGFLPSSSGVRTEGLLELAQGLAGPQGSCEVHAQGPEGFWAKVALVRA